MPRLLLILLLLLSWAYAQENLRTPVALLESGGETGAAILVGQSGDQLYFLTAAHVIVDPEDLQLRFSNRQTATASIVNSDSDLDLAAISCKRPSGMTDSLSYSSANRAPSQNEEVIVVGHPLGHNWDINQANKIKESAYGVFPGRFTLYPMGIGPGSSGGPVWDKDQALLGMVTEVDQIKTVCIEVEVLKRACSQWEVPTDLMMGAGGTSKVQPGTQTQNTDPLVGEMILVKGGSFQMGGSKYDDEKPVHQVSVPDFYLGKYEVTQAQWKAIMGENPSHFKNCDQCPVEQVSWEDVQKFIKKLNQKTRKTYRLPSEAEWEYAAGGGNGSRNKWAGADSESALGSYAWYYPNRKANKTHPVGEKQANGLGFYDMSGNVFEWCQDWYHDTYSGAPSDGSAWETPKGTRRVDRGGSWNLNSGYCHVARRNSDSPASRYSSIGFRLARTE